MPAKKSTSIALSSRIRLARNLKDYAFPQWLSEKELSQVKRDITKILSHLKPALVFHDFNRMADTRKLLFLEKHLVSPAFLKDGSLGRVLAVKNGLSVMINEEDHLRLQCILPGLSLNEAFREVSKLDDKLGGRLEYAFTQETGFLTACPTNLGTALRASVMLHLPALTLAKRMPRIINSLNEKRIAVRGLFGEGTLAIGHFFQISNQATLGITEIEVIKNLDKTAQNIIKQEKIQRNIFLKKDKLQLEDKIERALGVLKHARLISFEEALEYLSILRLGSTLGLLSRKLNLKKIDNLSTIIRAGHLRARFKRKMSREEEDSARSELIRSKLQI